MGVTVRILDEKLHKGVFLTFGILKSMKIMIKSGIFKSFVKQSVHFCLATVFVAATEFCYFRGLDRSLCTIELSLVNLTKYLMSLNFGKYEYFVKRIIFIHLLQLLQLRVFDLTKLGLHKNRQNVT